MKGTGGASGDGAALKFHCEQPTHGPAGGGTLAVFMGSAVAVMCRLGGLLGANHSSPSMASVGENKVPAPLTSRDWSSLEPNCTVR